MTNQRVYIVDDDEAMRDSLVWLLESQGLAVSSYAAAEDFLAACGEDMAGCIVLDVRMPGMSGLELYEKLNARRCSLPVIFITGHGDVPMAVSALKKGAVDFIEKPFNDKELLRVIGECLERERTTRAQRLREGEAGRRLASLTEREREVMDLVLAGKLNKQIADVLNISIKTVEVHRARIMDKMAVRTVAELVQAAMPHRSTKQGAEK
ncbi:MAG: response regulator transcription factor [Pelomonas sp.]|jgi:FixJ family two-component response regulator|nr:response regulator transcription factor [Roseateles sp.]